MRLSKIIVVLSILLLALGNHILWEVQIETNATNVSGPIWGTWTLANSPYYLDNNVTIPFGKTLKIEAGVQVIANGSYSIFVNGSLYANATEFNPITFTGNDTGSSDYFWQGIQFNSTSVGLLQNCTIMNATFGVRLNNTRNITIKNSEFIDNYAGILMENNSRYNIIKNCEANYNWYGVSLFNSHYNIINSSFLEQNFLYGLYFVNSSKNEINDLLITHNYYAFRSYGNSNHNIIKNCYLYYNEFGIQFFDNSIFNTIINSTVGTYSNMEDDIGVGFYDSASLNSIVNSDIHYNKIEVYHVINSNTIIDNCRIFGNTLLVNTYNMIIKNSLIYSPLKIFSSTDITIDNNTFYPEESGIEITSGSSDIQISNCQLTGDYYQFDLDRGVSKNASAYLLSDSRVESFYGVGVYIKNSNYITIQNTNVSHFGFGMALESSDNISIHTCDINTNKEYGVFNFDSSYINIENCNISENTGDGMGVEGFSDNIDLVDTKFFDNSKNGYTQECSGKYFNFDNCEFIRNEYGLKLIGGINANIRSSIFYYNTYYAIYANPNRLNIYNSKFIKNENYGMVTYCDEIYVFNSTFLGNHNDDFDIRTACILKLINTTYDSDISTQGNSLVFIGWYLDIEVRLPDGPPVSEVKVNITSEAKESYKNDFELTPELNLTYPEYSTGQNGQINGIVCYQYIITSGYTYNFNPYKINAQRSNYGIDSVEINLIESKKIMMQLSQLDLSVTRLSIPNPYNRVPVNEYFIVTAEIKNSGTKDFNNVGLQFLLTGQDIDYSYLSKITHLPAESRITVEMEKERLKVTGKYTVEVIVDYDDNIFEFSEENNRIQKELIVTSRPVPVLKANATKVYVGENLTFYANESYGPEPILEYIFNFDDGNIISLSDNYIIEHKFGKTGTYMVSLSVKDIYGITSISNASIPIEVVSKPKPLIKPIARFRINPLEGDVTTTFTFDPSESTPSPDAYITIYNWNFGDNTSNSWEKPTHEYADDDIYTITLVIKDTNGLTSEKYSQKLKIHNLGPTAELYADRTNITEGDQIIFNATGTHDPDDTLKEQLTRFVWYFGDGEEYFETPIKYVDGKYDKLAAHIYMEPGEYIITLIVYDDDGASNQTSIKITVNPLAKKGTGESDPTGFSTILLMGSILIILLIFFITLLFLVLRRKKQNRKSENAVVVQDKLKATDYYTAAQSSYDSNGYGTPPDPYSSGSRKTTIDAAKGKGEKGKQKSKKGKLKHVYGIERSSSLRPMEVEVEVPDEKVVDWKGEQSALNSTLTIDDVDIVTNGELSTAPIIGTDDEDQEEFDQFEDLEEFEDLGDGSFEDIEPSTEYQEESLYDDEPEDFEPVESFSEYPEISDEQPVEFYTEPAKLPETEPELAEAGEDKLVFEFQDDGVIKTAELEAVAEEDIGTHLEHQKPKKKEKLIAIPGIGFVTRDELQKAISGKNGTIESSNIDSDEYSYPNGTPLKIDDSLTMGFEPDSKLRCMWCDKPISGKYIKVRRKDDQGLKFGVLGPFCSQECATKFGK